MVRVGIKPLGHTCYRTTFVLKSRTIGLKVPEYNAELQLDIILRDNEHGGTDGSIESMKYKALEADPCSREYRCGGERAVSLIMSTFIKIHLGDSDFTCQSDLLLLLYRLIPRWRCMRRNSHLRRQLEVL